jgi:hypothetical protein
MILVENYLIHQWDILKLTSYQLSKNELIINHIKWYPINVIFYKHDLCYIIFQSNGQFYKMFIR